MLIQIFCKAPIAGQVKTRLTPHLSPTQAMQLHQQLAWHTFKQVQQTQNNHIELWCAPTCQHPFFQKAQKQFNFKPQTQVGTDLGTRMGYALQQGLKKHSQVLLCGTDCPQLTADKFQQARDALKQVDAVLIPATDGGYVLIGLRRYHAELFTNITWGSDQVCQQTIAKLIALNYSYRCLSPLSDIDRPTDLSLLDKSVFDI